MNYKKTLFFITKSLTILSEEKNRFEIEFLLKKNNIEWNSVVKLSTKHYVLPALFINLKRAQFLKYIPSDLVNYMKFITEINRERNQKIILQSKKINFLLKKNGITPIFLKGTGGLIAGLYNDIAERMVGDIDFLIKNEDHKRAYEILSKNNYYKPNDFLDNYPDHRHYPRLISKNNIAAVEIHKDLTIGKYRSEFNYKTVKNDIQLINGFSLLSFENKLSLSIISSQINDYGYELNNISLRNAYDVFLLSKKINAKKYISKFVKLKNPLNCFLANCNFIFGELKSLEYHKTAETKKYLNTFNKSILNNGSNYKFFYKLLVINFKRRFIKLYRSIFDKNYRIWLFKRINRRLKNNSFF